VFKKVFDVPLRYDRKKESHDSQGRDVSAKSEIFAFARRQFFDGFVQPEANREKCGSDNTNGH
jgi:hypothetical protein